MKEWTSENVSVDARQCLNVPQWSMEPTLGTTDLMLRSTHVLTPKTDQCKEVQARSLNNLVLKYYNFSQLSNKICLRKAVFVEKKKYDYPCPYKISQCQSPRICSTLDREP
ncbi:hypothetical protein T06_7157 [Trichinella sp. T6]|nr:hypothetical protein T06_7157 [Trichinella sp. T6]